MLFPPRRSSPPVSRDDYFPHNPNKNDLAKTRSFLVRVERVELPCVGTGKGLNLADFGRVEPKHRVAIVVRDRLISSTLSSSWATGGQHQLGRGRRWLAARRGAGDRTRALRSKNQLNQAYRRSTPPNYPFSTFINFHQPSATFASSWATRGQRLGRGGDEEWINRTVVQYLHRRTTASVDSYESSRPLLGLQVRESELVSQLLSPHRPDGRVCHPS
jgi:hypothetical protein